jgi:hypothetical protein
MTQTLPKVHGPGSPALRRGRTQIEVCKYFPAKPAYIEQTGKTEVLRSVRTLRFPTRKEALRYAELGIPVDGEVVLHVTRYSASDGWTSHAAGTRQLDGTWTDSFGNALEA